VLERLPEEVKGWDMIHKFLGKKGAREEEFARKAEEVGHVRTAWESYNRAAMSFFLAQHTICEDDNPEKIRLNQRLQACHEKVRKYNEYPIEKILSPHCFTSCRTEGKLPAYSTYPEWIRAKKYFPIHLEP
jgi:hypothetical protein